MGDTRYGGIHVGKARGLVLVLQYRTPKKKKQELLTGRPGFFFGRGCNVQIVLMSNTKHDSLKKTH